MFQMENKPETQCQLRFRLERLHSKSWKARRRSGEQLLF